MPLPGSGATCTSSQNLLQFLSDLIAGIVRQQVLDNMVFPREGLC